MFRRHPPPTPASTNSQSIGCVTTEKMRLRRRRLRRRRQVFLLHQKADVELGLAEEFSFSRGVS